MAKVWLVECGEYEQSFVAAAFRDEDVAEEYAAANEGTVESVEVWDRLPAKMPLHVRIAEVYPDKEVKRYSRTEEWDEPGPKPLESDGQQLFDGHMQTHCGFHIYVSGGDEARIEAVFERKITEALERCDGTCPGCGRTDRFLVHWLDPPTHEVDVRLVGGPFDGEIETTSFAEGINDPTDLHVPVDGLVRLHGTVPDGLTGTSYGTIKKEGDEYVRHHIRSQPVEHIQT
jgi:hypothetical protein